MAAVRVVRQRKRRSPCGISALLALGLSGIRRDVDACQLEPIRPAIEWATEWGMVA